MNRIFKVKLDNNKNTEYLALLSLHAGNWDSEELKESKFSTLVPLPWRGG